MEMEDTIDVMDDGRIIVDLHGYQGETCTVHLKEIMERLSRLGIKGSIEETRKKNSVLAAPQGMTIRG